ncbi:response regulator transcription factor [Desulforamulus ruminis]|uniref:Stage 0 sporulation protein A homolog n=1 Tax=Desulforamulus ruminis (strain ATCC 23193 / DSM 2154 / NCIMB 8452 / DL) TaxID=696281 RepID=F6DLE2_DESRL|nr:response regulator transcription factor [Desulforamulus ruminis]AEG60490.1 response regulator receiver [Desulforamulus ruminis DSM 2154]
MTKILVVEDESAIRSFIAVNLRRQGYDPVEAASGEEALAVMEQQQDIAVAILDVMLPGMDGFAVCRALRERFPAMGMVMLTAKGQEQDKVQGLQLGADDYVVKPFSPKELLARIESLLRRLERPTVELGSRQEASFTSGPFIMRPDQRKFYKDSREIELTPREFAIIKLFMENPKVALSRDDVLNSVWGKNYIGDLKTVDVNIRRIRQKIEDKPEDPKYIQSIWGYGYRWLGGD